MAFAIRRGTNLGCWLSQAKHRGAERAGFFTAADAERIAGWGFDHVRLPVDEEQLWDEAGRQEAEAFDLLDAGLDACLARRLRVIVDLHITRSHYFNSAALPALFTDDEQVARFADLWRQLSQRLCARDTDYVAYELLNEPVAADPADWNRVYAAAWDAIRSREPRRMLVLGSNDFQQPKSFPDLRVPEDPHCILSFHYYYPMFITHYRARWWGPAGLYDGPVQYPGPPIPPERLAAAPAELRELCERRGFNRPAGPESVAETIAPVLAVRDRTGLAVHCGEFGCYATTSQETRRAWFGDVIAAFRDSGVAWSQWLYKGAGFGLVDPDGRDLGIVDVLLG